MALSARHLRGQRRTGDQPKLSPLPVSISPKVNLTCSLPDLVAALPLHHGHLAPRLFAERRSGPSG